jgi:sugar lactone lactonase YvrE
VLAGQFTSNPARVPVMIQKGNGRLSNVDIFFVVPRPPRLEGVEPSVIEVGTEDFEIRVFGDSFKPNAKLVVNNQVLELTSQREGRLVAMVPAAFRSAPGILTVRVEQDGIQSTNETIQVSPTDDPFIFSITPALIRQGDNRETIEIIGANFGNNVKVFLDGEEVGVKESFRRRLTIVIKSDLLATTGNHTLVVVDENDVVSNTFTFSVVPDVEVTTLVGAGRDGFNQGVDCVSAEDARLRRPRRLALGPDGLIYVTDQQNHAIRTINPDTGEVCLIAGTGISGYSDSGNSRGFDPSFSFPNGLAVASNGDIYVTENGNNVIRRIVRGPDGSVTVETFAGQNQEITGRDRQDKLNSTRVGMAGFRDGPSDQAAFRRPDDILIAPDGSIYFVDANNHSIRRIRNEGGQVIVESIAGNGVPGYADGNGPNVRFNTPTGLALSDDGRFLFVADTNNNRIRRIDLLTGAVETVAGSGRGNSSDGPVGEAGFSQPIGIAIDIDGTIYVSEVSGNTIRRIDTSGNVTTVAGISKAKFRDGVGLRATFANPRGLLLDRARGILYVADTENFRVREIQLR